MSYLVLRYLPAYAKDLETTMNAQMARGYKLKGGKGLFARIINTVPLLLPVSIGAMLSIYDIADGAEGLWSKEGKGPDTTIRSSNQLIMRLLH